jgi:superfamily II DNA helicase RecQ
MSLQYKFFTVRSDSAPETEEELNLFLRSHKILAVRQEFLADGINSGWHLAVEYLAGRPAEQSCSGDDRKRIDYRETLDPPSFSLYARLRDWRKQTAEQEAVPLYTIFTNKQLAQIAAERITTKDGLQKVEGIGAARIDKYGAALTELVASAEQHEAAERTPSANC